MLVYVKDYVQGYVICQSRKNITHLTQVPLCYAHHGYIWKHFRLLYIQISDRGAQFAASFMEELCKRLGVKKALTMTFHSQTDGEMERVNQKLEQYLRVYCNHKQNN